MKKKPEPKPAMTWREFNIRLEKLQRRFDRLYSENMKYAHGEKPNKRGKK